MAVNRYAVKIISEYGNVCWLGGQFCGKPDLPLLVLDPPPGTSFRKAHDAAVQLRRLYPIVKVVGVYE